MPTWIAATLTAALFQCWRTAMQQRLRGAFTLNGAAVVRYLYGVPPGLALLLGYAWATGAALPAMGARTVALSAAAGLLQIFGTNLLIASFAPRGFAVGTAYSKTEGLQSAVFGLAVLGERLSALAWAGIGVGVAAVLWLSLAGRGGSFRDLLGATAQPAALYGLGAGTCFALTGICVRAATQDMAAPDPILAALAILVVTNLLQTAMQGGWMLLREPASLLAVLRGWRVAAPVGLLSALGSACWFTGFALAPVALVRAVGQTEMLFTLAFSRWYLRERTLPRDAAGALLIVASVVLVVLGR